MNNTFTFLVIELILFIILYFMIYMAKCIQNPTFNTWLWLSIPFVCIFTIYIFYKELLKIHDLSGIGGILLIFLAAIILYITKFLIFKNIWGCVNTNILIVLIILFIINIILLGYRYYMYKKSEAEYIVKINKVPVP